MPRDCAFRCGRKNLKRAPLRSDTTDMLFIARSAPEPKTTQLVSLCCSLNSPVVSIPELPVGPASAAIAVHSDIDEGTHITVAVQCQRTGDVALFRARGEPGEPADASSKVVLLWAEGMGFLFDDELCVESSNETGVRNEVAMEVWRNLVRGSQPAGGDPPARQIEEPDPSTVLSKFRIHWSQAQDVMLAGAETHESNQRPNFVAAVVA